MAFRVTVSPFDVYGFKLQVIQEFVLEMAIEINTTCLVTNHMPSGFKPFPPRPHGNSSVSKFGGGIKVRPPGQLSRGGITSDECEKNIEV